MATSLNVGIVGGSIAGCAAAILLRRAGHEVTVFERTTGKLQGRGGGIATPRTTFGTLVDEDIIDADFPHTQVREMPFIGRVAPHDRWGRTAWTLPVDLICFHWGTLWENLRSRVPDHDYHQGCEVTGVRGSDGNAVELQLDGRTPSTFDLVLFADGYRSLGRRLQQPNAELRYRGYVLWRGLLPESRVKESSLLAGKMPRLSYAHADGHLVTYLVPGLEGATEPGSRLYNWAAYLAVPEEELPALLIDSHGLAHEGSLPPGSVRAETEQRFKALMAANLPAYFADIISSTENTYIQLIYTADVKAYAHHRTCLLGDAGSVVQPFTISGVFKGFHNARDLVQTLARPGSVDAALADWSQRQSSRSQRILAWGAQMEQALIWDPLDFGSADAATTEAWWRTKVARDESFGYEQTL